MEEYIEWFPQLIKSLTKTEIQHLDDTGYNSRLGVHYWTEEDDVHSISFNDANKDTWIPQPE